MNAPAVKTFLVAAALFFAPAVYFVVRNVGAYDFVFLLPIVAVTAAAFAVVVVASLPALLLPGRDPFVRVFFALACFWFLQFTFLDMRSLTPDVLGLRNAAVAAVFVLFALSLGAFARSTALQRTVLVFLVLNLGLAATANFSMPGPSVDRVAGAEDPASARVVTGRAGDARDVNIYYVIVDGMASPRNLKSRFGLDIASDLAHLAGRGYYVAPEARSSYNTTDLTLASIFHQGYFRDETSPPYAAGVGNYPSILQAPGKLKLFASLDALGYRVTHIGNPWGPCVSSRKVHCINEYGGREAAASAPRSFVAALRNNYAVAVFFENSLLIRLFDRATGSAFSIDNTDAIATAIAFVRDHPDSVSSVRNFFFIHHLNPHPPYRAEDCALLDEARFTGWDVTGYRSSAVCTLRRIREFADLIAAEDPTAMVVFQADHGPAVTYDFDVPFETQSPDQIDERFSIFNAIRVPADCRAGLAADLGNVETIDLVIGCAANDPPPRAAPRSYAGFYESNSEYGTVKRVIFAPREAPSAAAR